jgi:hypothetical protein
VNDALPDEAQWLLNGHFDSYESLLVLTVMREDREREWSEEALRTALQSADGIPRALRSLQARGLVRPTSPTSGSSYVYAPHTPALDSAMATVVRIYREQPTAVIKFFSANALQRVRKGALRAFIDVARPPRK